jgi:drug/metabolite transporter (DMT)-like permease
MTDEPRRPAVFDIRIVIAVLIGLYGLVITVLGLFFTTDAEIQKSAGVNINLWGGLGMLVTAAGFVIWARLRPLAPVRSSTTD